MKILSWDIGIINLSYCILDFDIENNEKKILEWGIINLIDSPEMKKDINLIFENIPKKLKENDFLINVDYVVIENQPSLKNPKMKSIQMIVYSYFLMFGKIFNISENKIKQIDFCNASNKLKVYDGPKINIDDLKKKKKINQKESIKDFVIENKDNEDENKDNEIQIKEKQKKIKLSYTDKKKMAIEHVKYYLNLNNDEYNIKYFNEHKKKDDLADSYLQGLYMINKIQKKNRIIN